IDLPDDSFDLVICSHVLEHVSDDRAAISELERIVAPGGMALILTPYRPHEPTREDPSVTTPMGRMLAFGQHDHVRLCGADRSDRLREPGWDVRDLTNQDLFGAETIERFNLVDAEHFFCCRAASRGDRPGEPAVAVTRPAR